MTEVTNRDRAEWARIAVQRFMDAAGMTDASEPLQDGAGDLLANMIHLARREGWNWDDMLARAKSLHDEEVAEDSEE